MTAPRLCTFGSLKEEDLYIERPADAELQQALRNGEYAYVLSARQTGKSSLLLHTLRALRTQGIRCAKIDLGAFGSDAGPAVFYESIAAEIADTLRLDDAIVSESFAPTHRITPVRRFLRFLGTVVAAADSPLVVFIDEIEGFLKLPMALGDDFLTALRTLHNDRGREPLYRRLSFCLMGVCTPAELIRDQRRTPFNVARNILLTDFRIDDLRVGFRPCLQMQPHVDDILARVHHFTSGHPYLSHRLVQTLVDAQDAAPQPPLTADAVDRAVTDLFLQPLGREQENILEVERRLCLGPAHRVRQRIELYRAIRAGARVVARSRDPIQLDLHLTGLVTTTAPPAHARMEIAASPARAEPILVVRNRILATLFDDVWTPKSDPAKLDPAVWIQQQVAHWHDFDRKDAFVLRGEELFEAQNWATAQPALDAATLEFLSASERVDGRERAIRLYALLWTVLWSSFTNFLLATALPGYFHHRAYAWPSIFALLYGLPFVMAPASGWIADRLRIAPATMLTSGLGAIFAGCLGLLVDAALPLRALAWLALPLILLGQVLQRPHIATLVGLLYPRSDPRLELTYVAYYFFVNVGALLGPLLGSAAFHSASYRGLLATLLLGSSGALYAFAAARDSFLPANLPLRREPAESPADIRTRRRQLLLLTGAMAIFWTAFYAVGEVLQSRAAKPTETAAATTSDVLLQGLSSEAITPLLVIALAPLLAAAIWLARRLHREPSAHTKVAAGFALLLCALVAVAWPVPMRSPLPLALTLLTLAELLIVPASMSMTTALSSTPLLSATMGGYFLVMGLGAWTAELLTRSSTAMLAWLLPTAACTLLFRRR